MMELIVIVIVNVTVIVIVIMANIFTTKLLGPRDQVEP